VLWKIKKEKHIWQLALYELDIRVIFEDTEILYEGALEDAPEEIKKLRYSKVENSDKMNFYVYNLN